MASERRVLLAGDAAGRAMVLGAPLSFWGGMDPETGRVTDRRHPRHGESLTGAVVVMPFGRGSSSASSSLAESIRLGTGPAALLLDAPDEIVLIGALVAAELYGVICPVVVLGRDEHAAIPDGVEVRVRSDGTVRWATQPGGETTGQR